MPQTTRLTKIPGLALNQAKLVADHRKKTVFPSAEKKHGSVDRGSDGNASIESPTNRNISQTAWKKIRLAELRKKDRLNFNDLPL